mmetsp:Transcript_78764/g.227759  ORF Transcript_78764/g.227759 Transcript_78764/m.227759 type:complete len:209 (-) Transcript_78764:2232-2858(-)
MRASHREVFEVLSFEVAWAGRHKVQAQDMRMELGRGARWADTHTKAGAEMEVGARGTKTAYEVLRIAPETPHERRLRGSDVPASEQPCRRDDEVHGRLGLRHIQGDKLRRTVEHKARKASTTTALALYARQASQDFTHPASTAVDRHLRHMTWRRGVAPNGQRSQLAAEVFAAGCTIGEVALRELARNACASLHRGGRNNGANAARRR